MEPPYSALVIANTFLEIAKKDGFSLKNSQLQKLVFLSHGYYLAFFGEEHLLFYDDIYAWTWGPVIPELYKKLQRYGDGIVYWPIDVDEQTTVPEHDLNEYEVIAGVWEAYKNYTVIQFLMLLQQKCAPWDITWMNKPFSIIEPRLIAEYYLDLLNITDEQDEKQL